MAPHRRGDRAGRRNDADCGQLVSIGTLLAFVLVSIGIIVLRRTAPDRARPFRTPGVPFVPIAGAVICLAQMVGLPGDLDPAGRLAGGGPVVYFTDGRLKSQGTNRQSHITSRPRRS